jgi:hypothetical protein
MCASGTPIESLNQICKPCAVIGSTWGYAMCLLAVLVAVVAMSGCNTSALDSWQKQGADQQTVSRDTSTCHDVARAEALQRKPFQPGSLAPFGMPSTQQSDDLGRSSYDAEQFEACIKKLGYHRG